jgi:hypothetical protein
MGNIFSGGDTMDLHEEIRKVAYELYEKRGRIGGRQLEYWLEAERIVMARHAHEEKGGKVEKPTATHPVRKTPVKSGRRKAEAQDKGLGAVEARKPRAKKTGPKKTARTAK